MSSCLRGGRALPALLGMALGLSLAAPQVASAQVRAPRDTPQDQILKTVRLEQRVGEQIPTDLSFQDETGQTVQLAKYFGRRPVMLMLLQLRCTMLCDQEQLLLQDSLRRLKLRLGQDFTLLTVSIDPREGPDLAREKQGFALQAIAQPEAEGGWHFLTGSRASIDRLCEAVGFHYVYDRPTDQYAHPDGVIIATPEGKLARYFVRLNYDPRDLRLGLVEASRGRIGTAFDALALLCYHYNPSTGKYGLAIMAILRFLAVATVLVLAVSIGVMNRKQRPRLPITPSIARGQG